MNGELTVFKDDLKLAFKMLHARRKAHEADSKNINDVVDLILHQQENI